MIDLDLLNSLIPMLLMDCPIQNMNQCKKMMSEPLGKRMFIPKIWFSFRFYRSTLLGDIRRILYPSSACNRIVYDFDAIANRSTITTLSNNDNERYENW